MSSKNVHFAKEPLMDEEDIQYLRRKRRKIDESEGVGSSGAAEQELSNERKQQHTLDSDEEEDKKYDRLDMNKVFIIIINYYHVLY